MECFPIYTQGQKGAMVVYILFAAIFGAVIFGVGTWMIIDYFKVISDPSKLDSMKSHITQQTTDGKDVVPFATTGDVFKGTGLVDDNYDPVDNGIVEEPRFDTSAGIAIMAIVGFMIGIVIGCVQNVPYGGFIDPPNMTTQQVYNVQSERRANDAQRLRMPQNVLNNRAFGTQGTPFMTHVCKLNNILEGKTPGGYMTIYEIILSISALACSLTWLTTTVDMKQKFNHMFDTADETLSPISCIGSETVNLVIVTITYLKKVFDIAERMELDQMLMM